MKRAPLLIAMAIVVLVATSVLLPERALRGSALGDQLGSVVELPQGSTLRAWSFVTDQDSDRLPELQAILLVEGPIFWSVSLHTRSLVRHHHLESLVLQGMQGKVEARKVDHSLTSAQFFALNPNGWLHCAGRTSDGTRSLRQVLPDRDRVVFPLKPQTGVFAYSELLYPGGEAEFLQFRLAAGPHVTLHADSAKSGQALWEYPLWEAAQANERMTVMPVNPPGTGSHFVLVQRLRPATMDYGAGLGFDLLASQSGELVDWISPDPLTDDRELRAVDAVMSPRGAMQPWIFCTAREKAVGASEELWSAMLLNFVDEEIELLPVSQTLSAQQAIAQVGLLPRVAGGEFSRMYLQRTGSAAGKQQLEFAYCADWRDSPTWTSPVAYASNVAVESGSLLARWVDDRDGDGHAELLCAAHLLLVDGQLRLATQLLSGATGKPMTLEHSQPLVAAF